MTEPVRRVRVSIASHPHYLEALRDVVRDTAAMSGFAEDDAEQIVLAAVEGWTNVIRHCYSNCYEMRIDLEIRMTSEDFTLEINDYGKFVPPTEMKGRDLDDVRPGGLGLHLMNRVMDEVSHTKNEWGGTSLRLSKKIPERDPDEEEDW